MAGVEEWKKFFEREGSGFNIFDTIHCAIAVASLLKPDELKRHRDEIVAEIMAATQQMSKNNKVHHYEASKIKLDDKITMTSTSTGTGVSAVSLDEESLQQKLETSKRKLQQGYKRIAAAKKQRSLKVLELKELPKKVELKELPKKVPIPARSNHLHGQNNRKLCAL